ncbi:hypothetical protein BP5796_09211 [Coleophoma crateriformis]|uniref:DUF6314 domain-containing protein n=1 Tax=Coleophoma crateriformis TaxID=565419 RepID=A0A3D8R410_9HELO|nr:hypothetical protein BP5796_09211 [Coleophoma crateriformis]
MTGKRVCIVGAGPSGLVAAKTLLHEHPGVFQCTIYEKSDRIGGLWPSSESDVDGMVHPDMCTNQSKHTVAFSDLAWDEAAPSFPKAWQVGQYLQKYLDMYLKPSSACEILTKWAVVKIDEPKSEDGKGATEGPESLWKVLVKNESSGETAVKYFDHVLIASGFFGKPKVLDTLGALAAPVSHSSHFRNIPSLLSASGKQTPQGTKIVVVGGQMSGVEVAASIAMQISSAVYSPIGQRALENAAKYTIHNVVQRPFWVMPLYFPENPVLETEDEDVKMNNPASPFLPLDLVMYNLAWKPEGPIKNTSGEISPEAAEMTNDFMNKYVGSDQSELGTNDLAMKGEIRSKQPFLACSDQYTEFIRSGEIVTHRGRVTEASPDGKSIVIENQGSKYQLDDVAAVVFATGFKASPSISYFSSSILEQLQFDADSSEFPLALNVHSTAHHAIPSLGFVGFYRSPYWGVMEMQARFLGKLWTNDEKVAKTLADDDTVENVLKLRKSDRLAQFPMGDYAYLMESFSECLGIQRLEEKAGRNGIVLPQRYLPQTASELSRKQRDAAYAIIRREFQQSREEAKFVARAVFRALQGIWKVERTLISQTPAHPTGTFSGKASFHPRDPSDNEGKYDLEYLYNEAGEFKIQNGPTFPASRRYAYRYQTSKDELSAWFIKPADNHTVDYLFHELSFHAPPDSQPNQGWMAKGKHLCEQDWYNVVYEFQFKGVALQAWTMEYDVKGPTKDYRIRSVYER